MFQFRASFRVSYSPVGRCALAWCSVFGRVCPIVKLPLVSVIRTAHLCEKCKKASELKCNYCPTNMKPNKKENILCTYSNSCFTSLGCKYIIAFLCIIMLQGLFIASRDSLLMFITRTDVFQPHKHYLRQFQFRPTRIKIFSKPV